jgi:hypothetical protein
MINFPKMTLRLPAEAASNSASLELAGRGWRYPRPILSDDWLGMERQPVLKKHAELDRVAVRSAHG